VFLMTSHAGYEGFPRVLVEAMAAGLPAVVTEGSDTGGLIQQGVSGFVYGRDPEELADAIRAARGLDPHEGDRRRRGAECTARGAGGLLPGLAGPCDPLDGWVSRDRRCPATCCALVRPVADAGEEGPVERGGGGRRIAPWVHAPRSSPRWC
jgi:hypothetical protein